LASLHAIDDYLTTGVGDVKKLRPPRQELWLRVGDYRVFFLFHDLRSIEILAVKDRREAYR
jgi:mRNA-degrading endonuclease RelE of RelBE toxin-antitoxin system